MARSAFTYIQLLANPVKLCWCITGTVGPLVNTNQNWLCARLLAMAVSIYPVVCVHSCRILRTQYHCLWPNKREGLPLACLLTPTTPALPPADYLISNTHDIIGVVKNYLKNQQCILHGRVCYETLIISRLYLYSKSCMVIPYSLNFLRVKIFAAEPNFLILG